MNKTIVIDGVVGVGKSSLSEILAKEFGLTFFEEPVVNNPILDKFYFDKKRYSFPLQIFFLNKRFEMLEESENIENGCIMDRSIYGDAIFAKMLMEDGDMSVEEYNIYEELLTNMLRHVHPPKLMVYLETTVDNAVKKIEKRGRDFEQHVSIDYWKSLNKHYEEYFKHYNISKLLKINVDNLDFVNNEKDREYVVSLIKNTLAELENGGN